MHLLHTVSKESFTIQDSMDVTFFGIAMQFALKCYNDRKAGDLIHKILLTGDNYKFIADSSAVCFYFNIIECILIVQNTIK